MSSTSDVTTTAEFWLELLSAPDVPTFLHNKKLKVSKTIKRGIGPESQSGEDLKRNFDKMNAFIPYIQAKKGVSVDAIAAYLAARAGKRVSGDRPSWWAEDWYSFDPNNIDIAAEVAVEQAVAEMIPVQTQPAFEAIPVDESKVIVSSISEIVGQPVDRLQALKELQIDENIHTFIQTEQEADMIAWYLMTVASYINHHKKFHNKHFTKLYHAAHSGLREADIQALFINLKDKIMAISSDPQVSLSHIQQAVKSIQSAFPNVPITTVPRVRDTTSVAAVAAPIVPLIPTTVEEDVVSTISGGSGGVVGKKKVVKRKVSPTPDTEVDVEMQEPPHKQTPSVVAPIIERIVERVEVEVEPQIDESVKAQLQQIGINTEANINNIFSALFVYIQQQQHVHEETKQQMTQQLEQQLVQLGQLTEQLQDQAKHLKFADEQIDNFKNIEAAKNDEIQQLHDQIAQLSQRPEVAESAESAEIVDSVGVPQRNACFTQRAYSSERDMANDLDCGAGQACEINDFNSSGRCVNASADDTIVKINGKEIRISGEKKNEIYDQIIKQVERIQKINSYLSNKPIEMISSSQRASVKSVMHNLRQLSLPGDSLKSQRSYEGSSLRPNTQQAMHQRITNILLKK